MQEQHQYERELIRLKIVSVKTHFGFTTRKMCELLGGMNVNVFKQKCNKNSVTNFFKKTDLPLLKQNIKKLNQNFK